MFLEGIAQYLEDRGIGNYDPVGAGGAIFVNTLPSENPTGVQTIIALFPTGGESPDMREGYASPTFQVRTRAGRDPRIAYNKMAAIFDVLHGVGNVILPNGTSMVYCRGLQSAPVSMGVDASNRHEYSLNFTTHIRWNTNQNNLE